MFHQEPEAVWLTTETRVAELLMHPKKNNARKDVLEEEELACSENFIGSHWKEKTPNVLRTKGIKVICK